MRKIVLVCCSLILAGFVAFGQNGTIRGKVIDGETGESLIGATIVLSGTTNGTISDFDGNYTLANIPAGMQSITVSYVSYETVELKDIEVTPGEVSIADVSLGAASLEIEEVKVVARMTQRTEAAVQVLQMKSANLMDGISTQQISRLGDSDAASALKRVTGVSVQDGKYVYVRGLSDRYMKVTLNGAEIPGLDPNFNTVQMDLFPSNVVENIIVLKTYSPDQPSFSGGLVDIQTRTFPEKFSLNFSASTGFNTNTHFNDNYLSYQGGEKDFIGIDDGFRDAPSIVTGINLPAGISSNAEELYAYSSAFNKIWDPEKSRAMLDQSYSFSMGGQTKLFGKDLGLLTALSYMSESGYYEKGALDDYEALSATTVAANNIVIEDKGSRNVIWSGLFSANLRLNGNNRISMNYLRNQNGEKISRSMIGVTSGSDNFQKEQTSLEFLERSLSSAQIRGKHIIPALNNAGIEWMSSYTHSTQDTPDLRFFIAEVNEIDGVKYYDVRSNRKPERRYRQMWESNWNSRIDVTLPFTFSNSRLKVKFGAAHLDKYRNSDENRFTLNVRGTVDFNGLPSDFVADENLLGYEGSRRGVYYGNDLPTNRQYSFKANDEVIAAYLMGDYTLFDKLRISGGVRAEYGTMFIVNKVDTIQGDNPNLFGIGESEDLDFLPSFNLTYTLRERMNLRLGYSHTLGRPSFRERAPYEFYEYTEGISILGNEDLERVLTDNVDLRWEYFFKPGEMASASLFYKKIYSPIERYKAQTGVELSTYRNGNDADLYGLELEFRKNMDFMEFTKNFALGLNLTLVKSTTAVDSTRLRLARAIVPDFDDTRPLFSQAPYIINSYLTYSNDDLGLEANFAFNVEGSKIIIISKKHTPDVYQRPMPMLNFNVSKSVFHSWELSFSVDNILDSEFRQTMILENEDEYPFRQHSVGRKFSFGIAYTL